jgi:hypothetical protein
MTSPDVWCDVCALIIANVGRIHLILQMIFFWATVKQEFSCFYRNNTEKKHGLWHGNIRDKSTLLKQATSQSVSKMVLCNQ